MSKGIIIVADDDAAIRMVLQQALLRADYEVRLAADSKKLWNLLSENEGDLVISDVIMPDKTIFDLLPNIKQVRPEMPVIIMSAQNTFMTAIKSSQAGAYDYLAKPFDLDEMIQIVERAMAQVRSKKKNHVTQDRSDGLPFVGRSQAMQDIYRQLARMMQTELTILITGESGTGKELVARSLHEYGRRHHGPFVAINMAAIPRDLIESELFGHEKGAFTGANARASGRFEQANGGTLFLDEIGDMPMEAQTRLLRVLQQGEYMRVGGRTPIKTDVRIVAATNKNLSQLIHSGQFREDLFYRLNVVPIRIPALRERIHDIDDLVHHFFHNAVHEGLGEKFINSEGMELLYTHSWPGNVRELENFVRRLAALYPQREIGPDVIAAELTNIKDNKNVFTIATFDEKKTLSQAVEDRIVEYFQSFQGDILPSGLYQSILEEVEYPLIRACLKATNGNQIKAAEILGLNRNTLRKKVRDLGLTMTKNIR
ncbi:nitrogen regulation protein NR(I) [Bartonella tamiae]|uniref:DNA-binding transcriptional regulator NtrC n=1 Tax=Bartonella tamiae Th239 TaxID=1094558 RepID=J0R3T7_9HYPH|nr:nitrogen regulation protein NR(I) [Bartonella tamiae Th239]EJF93760.1 nitrogen regulation protein NR(I) [Bartonella tamiae Th307]